MPASDVPGWQAGYRFTAANYSGGEIADQTGYGSPIRDVNGTPTFETAGGYEGLLLDNTWHGRFWHPNAWQGTVVPVVRLERLTSGTHGRQMIVFDSDGASGNTGRLSLVFVGTDRNVQMTAIGADGTGAATLSDATIGAAALCHDQVRRESINSLDGITITQNATGTNASHGNEQTMGSTVDGAYLGALQGDTSDTTTETSCGIHIYELHFFEANPLRDASTEMQAFLAELAGDYA